MAQHRALLDDRFRFGGQRGTSRRTFLVAAGGGGAAAAWALHSYVASARPVAAGAVEAAVADYFKARVDAANSRRPDHLKSRIDPANRSLVSNETERSGYLSGLGSAQRWNGRMRGFATAPGILSTKIDKNTATVRAYEELQIAWSPEPVAMGTTMRQVARQDPQRYELDQPDTEVVSSAVGVAHELTLQKGSRGWVVTSDAYVEDLFLGASPDADHSAWAVSMNTPRPNNTLRPPDAGPAPSGAATPPPGGDSAAGVSPLVAVADPLDEHTMLMVAATTASAAGKRHYDWRRAVAYANRHWSSYNSAYPNYNPCGGDCANFISQCLRAGGQTSDRTWNTHRGSACSGRTSANAGSAAWVNNSELRNWLVRSKRGVAVSSIRQLGRGDIVNYDWSGNGSYDHVAIITNSKSMLVTAHNTNRHNVPWRLGARRHRFTWVRGTF